ncbi:probable short-chain dehydrogenase/reductase SDR [Crocosphaera subtropica ATCC 51142]|uniref:Probable short-chain dehydrogenase/reductase SDR n=1 Tax=Crocosphaera subtropica (strain ATCC 51142 / BH68) TaxID=43989 RepID=B1WPU7_CROS5|nr:SDR family NAD(P)-dependent oxidoreductase [Crocosphaera subtropica]ACB53262.1 probable short-chain dehydrogenase/reductase SDR [Crocosphaera subtropica ATCC 51142]
MITKKSTSKIALITGASSGIGEAIAHRLAEENYRLVICARRQEKLNKLTERLQVKNSEVLALNVDLRQEADIITMFNTIRDKWGGVDVLINNAGLGHKEPLMTGETEAWREMLEVNVLALCICTREAIKDMSDRFSGGHIIHISSMSGHRVPLYSGVYAASKYAVRALTEGLRQELREANKNIKISSISPGFVETEFAEKYNNNKEKAKELYSRFPVLQPQDIANAVYYILSQPDYVQIHDILLRPTQQKS